MALLRESTRAVRIPATYAETGKVEYWTALYHLARVERFLADPNTQVCRPFAGIPVPIAKDIGSDLAGLSFVRQELSALLAVES